ncbi:MAG: FtsQ-type POTRA domain-containing protein, partial [Thermodesulfobacteriota bacterium]|nr:FtsQ-type POTRA domain-containing protein [Thermodesulfobacteriota bacterium]
MSVAGAVRGRRVFWGRRRKGSRGKEGKGSAFGTVVFWIFSFGFSACLLAVLSFGFLAGFRWLTTTSFFALKGVETSGLVRLTEAEIVNLAGIGPGLNVLDLKISDIEARLLKDPWIERAVVARVLPDRLRIVVTERRPAYWVRSGKGLFYADIQGRPLAEVTADRFSSWPVLEVDPGGEALLSYLPEVMRLVRDLGPFLSVDKAAWIRVGSSRGVEIFFEEPGFLLAVA